MVQIIDLVSDTEVTPRLRRTRPRPVVNDAELSIVTENIHPARDRSSSPLPSSSAPPVVHDAHRAAPSTASKRNRRVVDDSTPQVVSLKKGINPLQDYVHPRFSCARVPFKPESAANFCPKCFCFVCDVNAAHCSKWADHCGAIDNEEWKRKRRDVRKATRRYDKGVDRLAKEARKREKRARHEQERRSLLQALGEDRDFAAVMAEQAHIVSQYRGVNASASANPLSSPQNRAQLQQPLGANVPLNPFQRTMNAGENLASTLPILASSSARGVRRPLATSLIFSTSNLLHGTHPVNETAARAPNLTPRSSEPLLPSSGRTGTTSSEDNDHSEECEDSADGVGRSEEQQRHAHRRSRENIQRLLTMQRRLLRARDLHQEQEQFTGNEDASKVTEKTIPTRHALGNSARGRGSRSSLNYTSFVERRSPFADETVIDRSKQKKRRRGRSEDRSSRKERSSSDSHSRTRKHTRSKRSKQA